MDTPSAELLGRWKRGDQAAADELFRRYVGRLTALARGRMSARLARRLDPEEIALSAYRSFFVRARDGRVSLEEGGGLWQLLVAIALNKLHRNVQHHRAAKRAMSREQSLDSALEATLLPRLRSREPATAEESAAIAEVFAQFLAGLTDLERQILELRLQDRSQTEIATQVGRSERTVRRILTELQHRLESDLLDQDASGERGSVSPPVRPMQSVDEQSDQEPNGESIHRATHPPADPGAPGLANAGGSPWLSDRDFLLMRMVGTGGTGKVYQALHRETQELVALKVLKKQSQADAEAVQRFLSEAAIVSNLRHPGIVPVRGVGRTKARGYFLVYDFFERGDLASACRGKQVAVADALRWVVEAARAVEHAHQQGVIHCDLKPSNLLLDAGGSIHVTDFGLAHLVRNPQPRHPAGTIGYMAPEQLDPAWGSIGPATDVFGLGAVLFALLTGQPPFLGATWETTVDALFHAEVPSLCARRKDIPEMLAEVCQKCLARDLSMRFKTAGALSTALDSVSDVIAQSHGSKIRRILL